MNESRFFFKKIPARILERILTDISKEISGRIAEDFMEGPKESLTMFRKKKPSMVFSMNPS